MNIARQIIKWGMGQIVPSSRLMLRGPLRIPSSETDRDDASVRAIPEIALTFDDGPHPEYTPRLLDRLAEAQIVATFFVIGEQAERHSQIVRRIASEGHQLGNHTYTHSEPGETSSKVFLAEVARTRRLLQDLTGQDCTLMRPPKGKLTAAKLLGLCRMNQTVVLWNVDPRDYAMSAADEMARWCDSYAATQGDIVLMHDNHPFAEASLDHFAHQQQAGALQFRRITDWQPHRGRSAVSTPQEESHRKELVQ